MTPARKLRTLSGAFSAVIREEAVFFSGFDSTEDNEDVEK